MALARLKSIESLRYCAPGEWGKLLGLDRVPEVRTLRHKIRLLCQDDQPGINGLVHDKEGLAIHRIDPVVSGRTQA